MSFKYSVIGDNSQENREWLEKLGYKPLEIDESDSMLYTKLFPNGWMFSTMWNFLFPKHYIDCRSNFELFKAVSAMREDSDYMQWFVSNEKIPGNYVPIPGFNGNPTIDLNKWWYYEWTLSTIKEVSSHRYHKATLTELQERFKL